MSDRKPMGMTWTSWIDKQIEASQKRGDFDNLPGKGKPLPGLDGTYDPDWWLKEKIKREKLDLTPPTIIARRKAETFLEAYANFKSEGRVRREATKLNEEIQEANKTDLGPLLPQALLDVESICSQWRSKTKD